MARYLPSLLDRLSDDEPEKKQKESEPFLQSRREWEATFLAEVETLLNTKRSSREVPEEYRYCSDSVLEYGIPDCTGMSVKSPAAQNELRSAIEITLRRFEPRLSSVLVSIEPPSATEPVLRFEVQAIVHAEPETEPIRFETILRTDQSSLLVKRGMR
jgi:type VI secretion system protein ImpF